MDGGAERRVTPSGGGGGGGGVGGGGLDKTVDNRTMLRFRPIAPKPITGGPVLENSSMMLFAGKRAKRKYVRVPRNSRRWRQITNPCEGLQKQEGSENTVVTPELVLENNILGEGSVAEGSGCKSVDLDPTAEKIEIHDNREKVAASKMVDRTVRVVDSWVTVESVMDSCMMDAGGIGRTDDEKVKNLASDTCPAFISDGLNRLRWVNEAYKKMVSWQEEEPSPAVMVWLKIKDKEVYSHSAFTCKVRLHYRKENGKCTMVVPCDAWKMDRWGFAWRLDVKAALSLGL